MKKRIVTLLLVLVMALGLLAVPGLAAGPAEAEAVTYMDSGRTAIPKLTLAQLRELFNGIPDCPASIYAKAPVTSGKNYAPATLSAAALNHAESAINYYRGVAGLAPISFTTEANTSAAMGALVLAMGQQFTHNPFQPEDMSDADFLEASYATGTSNISYSAGFSENKVLGMAVAGQIADNAPNNLGTLGHRRWLLNPSILTMGIGNAFYPSDYYDSYYTDVVVFGKYVRSSTVSDYNFISWPASGYNLSDTFGVSTPWSVTLNPNLYQLPSSSTVKVTLVRTSDNHSWTFSSSTSNDPSTSGDYFTINNVGYGVSNCIIFRPGYLGLDPYMGDYTVKITGLKDKSGNAAEINYLVKFAALDGCTHGNVVVRGKVDPTCTEKGYTGDTVCEDCGQVISKGTTVDALGHNMSARTVMQTPTCTEDGYSAYYCTVCGWVKESSVKVIPATGHSMSERRTIKAATCTEPGTSAYVCTVCGWVKESSVKVIPATGHKWDKGTVVTAATEGREGVKRFTCTVCKATEDRPYHICPVENYTDKSSDSSWAHAGIDYVVSRGIMNGTSATTFSPKDPFVRAQLVTVLYRMAGSPQVTASTPFTDLTQEYYKAPVAWAYASGIVNGTSATTFSPKAPVARQDFAAILYRYYTQYLGKTPAAGADLSSFPDAAKVRSYARDAMAWTVASGIIQGSSGKLDPTGTTTREQAAAIIMRYDLLTSPQ